MSQKPVLLAAISLGAWLFAAVTGCAIGTQRFGRVIDARDIGRIVAGRSTKQDILDLFGPPTSYSRLPGDRRATGRLSGIPEEDRGREEEPSALEESPASHPLDVEARPAEDLFTYEYREENERFFTALLFTYFKRDSIADTLVIFFDEKDVVKYMAFARQTEAEPSKETLSAEGASKPTEAEPNHEAGPTEGPRQP